MLKINPKQLEKDIADLYDIENNSFIAKKKDFKGDIFETEVGDINQSEFLPRLKVKRWDNECNFSVGLIDDEDDKPVIETEAEKIKWKKAKREVHFYPVYKTENVKPTQIRYIKLGQISPVKMTAEYEMFRHSKLDIPVITSYSSDKEALMLYGYYDVEKYFDYNNLPIPVCRISPPSNVVNPVYLHPDLHWVDIHFSHKDESNRDNVAKAIIDILKNYNVDVIREKGSPYFYYGKDGKQIKFCTMVLEDNGRIWFYINLGVDYHKSRDYYKEEDKPTSEANGLWEINPDIPETIIDEIVEKITKNINCQKQESSFTLEENQRISKLETILSNENWIKKAERIDINWSDKKEVEGYEFDVVLNEKPITNKIELSIETKGLKFLKQRVLTQQELDNGCYKPENAVGSFAVYHENKEGDYSKIGGKNYKAGKAFHIYRPLLEDSAGKKVWGKLNIDEIKGILSVEIPQEFLDNAVYPIKQAAGLEFGYTTAGTAGSSISDVIYGSLFTSEASAGDGDHIKASISEAYNNTTKNFKYAIYLHSNSGLVDNSITNEGTSTGGSTKTWYELAFPTAPSIAVSTEYVLVAFGESGYWNFYYDDGDGTIQGHKDINPTYDTFPATASFTHEDKKHSIYCTYTAAGAPPPAPVIRRRHIFHRILALLSLLGIN